MGKAHAVITKIHRVCAGLLLLSMVPAAIVSFQGSKTSFFVYLPLLFLFPLIITGTYQLVLPWIRKYKARRATA
jgi:uncharacterized membrane protein YfhO